MYQFRELGERKRVLQADLKAKTGSSDRTLESVSLCTWKLPLLELSARLSCLQREFSVWLSRTGVTPFPQDTLVRFTPCPATSPTPPHPTASVTKTRQTRLCLSSPTSRHPGRWHRPGTRAFVGDCLPWRTHPAPTHEASCRKTFPH